MLQFDVIQERSLYIVLKVPSMYEDLKYRQKIFFESAYFQLTVEQRKQKSQSIEPVKKNCEKIKHKRQAVSSSRAPESAEQIVTIEDYLKLVKSDIDQEYRLLERLYPFFSGEFNHHDIMMISNCTRQQIDKMLEKHVCVLEKFYLK